MCVGVFWQEHCKHNTVEILPCNFCEICNNLMLIKVTDHWKLQFYHIFILQGFLGLKVNVKLMLCIKLYKSYPNYELQGL